MTYDNEGLVLNILTHLKPLLGSTTQPTWLDYPTDQHTALERRGMVVDTTLY